MESATRGISRVDYVYLVIAQRYLATVDRLEVKSFGENAFAARHRLALQAKALRRARRTRDFYADACVGKRIRIKPAKYFCER